MDEKTRFRLVLLGSAGTLMIGGIAVWQYVKGVNEQTEAAYNFENTPVKLERKRPGEPPTVQVAANPSAPNGAPLANNPGDAASVNPAVPAQPGAQSGVNVAGAAPGAKPGSLASGTLVAVAPTSPQPIGTKPAGANLPAGATATSQAASTKTAAVPASRPVPVTANSANLAKNTGAMPPGTPGITSEAQVPPIDSRLPDVATKVPATKYPAIDREEAKKTARLTAGKANPSDFSQLNFRPFPNNVQIASAPKALVATEKVLPPPPKPSGNLVQRAGQLRDRLVPPPPPSPVLSGTPGGAPDGLQLPIHQLPVPPERPSILDKFTVSAVIDDKAIFTISSAVAMQNKWPKVLTMGPGDQFESVSVVAVSGDSVTLEEDGERTVKSVPSVR